MQKKKNEENSFELGMGKKPIGPIDFFMTTRIFVDFLNVILQTQGKSRENLLFTKSQALVEDLDIFGDLN